MFSEKGAAPHFEPNATKRKDDILTNVALPLYDKGENYELICCVNLIYTHNILLEKNFVNYFFKKFLKIFKIIKS